MPEQMMTQRVHHQPSPARPGRLAETIGGSTNPRYKEVTSALQKIHEAKISGPLRRTSLVSLARAHDRIAARLDRVGTASAWAAQAPGRKTAGAMALVAATLIQPSRLSRWSGRDSNPRPPALERSVHWRNRMVGSFRHVGSNPTLSVELQGPTNEPAIGRGNGTPQANAISQVFPFLANQRGNGTPGEIL